MRDVKIKIGNIFKLHVVKWLVFASTVYVFVKELLSGTTLTDNYPLLFLIPLMGFQLRGILWEETYRQSSWDQEKELESWRSSL